MRDTAGLRSRSAVVAGALLLTGTLTQGVAHAISVRAETTALALGELSELGAAVAEFEASSARMRRGPSRAASGGSLGDAADALQRASESPGIGASLSAARWARISLAMAAVSTEVRALQRTPAASPRVLARLRTRTTVLTEELDEARAALRAEVQRWAAWQRWISWGGWGVMVLMLLGATRWLLGASMRSIDHAQRELADAERAVLDAADGERVRLGQELHDGLCQQLGGLRLLAQAAQRSSPDAQANESLQTLEELASRSLDMARTLSHGLYPGDVRAANLALALERLGTELAELGAFTFGFEGPCELSGTVSDADAMQLYRIAQEAISNAARHGSPSQVRIELIDEPLTLVIEDDGVGLSSTHDGSTTTGVGLSSMYARARAVDAGIRFYSTPREGTRVVVTRALRPEHDEYDSLDDRPLTPLRAWTKP